jgi:hypothetical protein
MDLQQTLNLGLLRRLSEAGVRMAYPTNVEILRDERGPADRSAATEDDDAFGRADGRARMTV